MCLKVHFRHVNPTFSTVSSIILFTAKKQIMERVDGYMKRAEDLKKVLESQNSSAPTKGGGGGGAGGITKRRTDGTYSSFLPLLSSFFDDLTRLCAFLEN